MPESDNDPLGTPTIAPDTYRTTRTTTVERVVRRGDKYIPIDERFDALERRVTTLTAVVIVDILLKIGSRPDVWEFVKRLFNL